jgi:S-formylglutathione hydrolase
MYSYVTGELPELVSQNFNADMDRQSVFGHSMGGHGAMVLALRNPGKYKSVSAFAPMCAPSQIEWGEYAFSRFLGTNRETWQAYDTVALINGGSRLPELLVDVGTADQFLESGIRPGLLKRACDETGIDLTLRMQDGYDHSYYFISTFMNDHLAWHAQRLGLTD